MSESVGEFVGGAKSEIVLDPTIKVPEGRRLMTVPAMVTAGPPTEIVVPAMEKPEGLGVKIRPARVIGVMASRVDVGVGSKTVELPITSAPD